MHEIADILRLVRRVRCNPGPGRLIAALLFPLFFFTSSPAPAQPDLVITAVSVRPLSAASNIRGALRYAAQIDVTVANIAAAISDRRIPTASPITLHLRIAKALTWTSRLTYTALPIYTCDYISVLDCARYAQYVQVSTPLPPGGSRTIPIIVQVTGSARDWVDPTRPLEGAAAITPEELACSVFLLECFLIDVFSGLDRSGTTRCLGRAYCYSIIAVVNRENAAHETLAARGNNIFIGRFWLPPQRLRPLGG